LQIAVHCFGNFAVGGESLVEGRSLPVNVHLYERSHEFSPPISPSYRHARILLDGDTVRTELSWNRICGLRPHFSARATFYLLKANGTDSPKRPPRRRANLLNLLLDLHCDTC
jgi:hypothetical protein